MELKWFLRNGIEIEMEMIPGIEIELKLKWYANNGIEMEIHNDFSNGNITACPPWILKLKNFYMQRNIEDVNIMKNKNNANKNK